MHVSIAPESGNHVLSMSEPVANMTTFQLTQSRTGDPSATSPTL